MYKYLATVNIGDMDCNAQKKGPAIRFLLYFTSVYAMHIVHYYYTTPVPVAALSKV
jgi:hypothetical protein